MEKQLHIVCPGPVSHACYGIGSLLFFELEALSQEGVPLVLHVFGEEPVSSRIAALCRDIHHYPICSGHKAVAFGIPYEVATRYNTELRQRILGNDHPVLFYNWEGTGVLLDPDLSSIPGRFLVRVLGVPHIQTKEAAQFCSGLGKKLFHLNESRRIRHFEKDIASRAQFLTLHEKDQQYLTRELQADTTLYPMLLSPKESRGETGMGNYCLYFGDFSQPEHERSAYWLLQEVFEQLPCPFVLAGRNPSSALRRTVQRNEHACLIESPSEEEVVDLIRKSHIQVLPFFSETGLKSEIYHALIHGRHCLYYGDGYACRLVQESCHHIADAEDARAMIESLFHVPFHEEAIALRNHYLFTLNDSRERARALRSKLFSSPAVP